jgi:Asp-tRNA(Asn)/Glu-tRNA(Gln) amidotransferase A subunit family amidase
MLNKKLKELRLTILSESRKALDRRHETLNIFNKLFEELKEFLDEIHHTDVSKISNENQQVFIKKTGST